MKLLQRFVNDEHAEMEKAMYVIILGVIAIVVALTLISAVLPGSVTTVSNTSAITGYSTWATGTQSMWGAIPIFGVLAALLLVIGVALVALKQF